jgi:peroxiredoxin
MKKIIYLLPLALIACSTSTEETEQGTIDSANVEVTAEKEVESEVIQGYEVGDMATDFSLMNVDDQMVSLADYTDAKGFIITFTCNHCPFSVANEDRLIALNDKYAPLGYPVIAINPNNPEVMDDDSDSFENMKIRAKEKGFTFPYLYDDGQHVFPQYGATKTPHMYVLEKTAEGNRVAYIGAIDDNAKEADKVTKKYVEDAVDALLRGEQPAVAKTVAIGCSIKS